MEEKNYQNILDESISNGYMLTYRDKLLTKEWKAKREQIIFRDGEKCCNCKAPKIIIGKKGYREKTQYEKDKYWEKISKLDLPNFVNKERVIYPKENVELHVHHKYYIKEKLPWDYQNDALITLCDLCHIEIHQKQIIPVYSDETKLTTLKLRSCDNCNGSGYLSQYKYYLNGACFSCSGTGYYELR